MFYVYLLKSKMNNQIYIGSTSNLNRRLKEHNDGEVFSTKRYRPWILFIMKLTFMKFPQELEKKN